MICLGINEDLYDSGVTLCDGPKVLYACNEERLTRRKNEGGFPRHSLDALFAYTKIDPADIGMLCVVGHMTPPFPVRLFPQLHGWLFDAKREKEDTLSKRLIDLAVFLTPVSHTSERSLSRSLVKPLLAPITRWHLPKSLKKTPIRFVEHHRAHAAGAWFASGFEEALLLTADGMGDGLSLTVSSARLGQGMERLWSVASRDSFGLFFEALAAAFGFMPCRDEGKITGLAGGGNPKAVHESSPFVLEQGHLTYRGPQGPKAVAWIKDTLLKRYSREDISAWAQQLLEDHLTEVAAWWLRETGLRHLAVAGGVFANVKLNQRLHELDAVDALFVYPNMGDGGLGLGAICAEEAFPPEPVRDVFWGESYTDTEIETALREAKVPYTRLSDIDAATAGLLAEGRIVARFQGRMEWGPRALGNRSILVRTQDRQVVDRLNTLLRRSDFMPFAPAVLSEDAAEYVAHPDSARHAAEFMTVCFDCTERMKQEHPAVVHLDGTARAQLVREESNPSFHRILRIFKERSGTGVLLNTSFNIHEEPIVRTPEEGVAAFVNARLDYLAIGPFLAQPPE